MKKLILPVLGIVFAVTSAFTTIALHKNADATLVDGYRKLNMQGTECHFENKCTSVVSAAFCTVGNVSTSARLWDLSEDQECIIPLYKP